MGIICGGAGKFWTSTELVDSVDLRFLERVGAIFGDCDLVSRDAVFLDFVKQFDAVARAVVRVFIVKLC